ncbi:MAG TPA: M28 family peptidase, partial [Anaerolineae bacterium]|nr:M28 family peptidase [Anaerolineae bacterium]
LMTAADSKNSFCFSISNKKGTYLRKLINEGKTVKVRAKIDSRYYTDDTLPYLTGCIRGTGDEGEEVLIAGHMFEWGANDNCTGCSIMLESVGVLNDLIRSGTLPRPKRSIRIWMGQEMYGSLAFAVHNPDRLRNTIAAVCCDTPAANHDLTASTVKIYMNGNFCPSFTDALYPEVFRLYYERIQSNKLLITLPYGGGTDNYFCEPMIGVPTNFVYMENGTWLHHNSRDTIEKVDTRSLDDLCSVNALYLYFLADADLEEIPYIARLTFDRGVKVILEKSSEMNDRLVHANDGVALGKVMTEGVNVIEYYTEVQKKALVSIERIVSKRDRGQSQKMLSKYIDNIDDFGTLCIKQFRDAVREKSKLESLKIVPYKKEKSPWDREAETLIPKPMYIGTLTLDGVPVEKWKEVTSSPRWWSPTSWAVASYWWCDGKRNLREIKELIELEAGEPVQNFDMITYYRFLDKYGRVEFVK